MIKWRLLPLLIFVCLAFFLWRSLSIEPQKLPSTYIGRLLPSFSLPLLGEPGKTLNSLELRGHPTLLNVWASWCSSCIQEQVFLLHLARQGVCIYGLNYKDNSQVAQKWLKEWGNPFQAILEDKYGKLAMDLGVYGAPETFLIDENGIIRYRHIGILDEQTWKTDFLPRIKAHSN